jgi:hypothetical protein
MLQNQPAVQPQAPIIPPLAKAIDFNVFGDFGSPVDIRMNNIGIWVDTGITTYAFQHVPPAPPNQPAPPSTRQFTTDIPKKGRNKITLIGVLHWVSFLLLCA